MDFPCNSYQHWNLVMQIGNWKTEVDYPEVGIRFCFFCSSTYMSTNMDIRDGMKINVFVHSDLIFRSSYDSINNQTLSFADELLEAISIDT